MKKNKYLVKLSQQMIDDLKDFLRKEALQSNPVSTSHLVGRESKYPHWEHPALDAIWMAYGKHDQASAFAVGIILAEVMAEPQFRLLFKLEKMGIHGRRDDVDVNIWFRKPNNKKIKDS